MPRSLTYRLPPFFYQLEDAILYASSMDGRSFWKSADEFVQEFFRADLEVERVSTILHADIEELGGG